MLKNILIKTGSILIWFYWPLNKYLYQFDDQFDYKNIDQY